MLTQNINKDFQNNFYINQMEQNTEVIHHAPSNDEYTANEKEYKQEDTLSLSTFKKPKILATPTKIYVDKVINNALDNISRGNNIEDNKRIIRLFSNLIQENPENILRKAYNL